MALKVTGDQTSSGNDAFRFVGRPRRRSDAPERLVGAARFAGDLNLPGLLHARFVRSPYASARIASIDAQAARQMPGVAAVLTARDLRVADLDQAISQRRILLALDRVLYVGQPVAVVLGESEAAAEDAAQAVEVEYEPLPAVVDPVAALAEDAPAVLQDHDVDEAELAAHGAAPSDEEEVETTQAPNVASRTRHHRGDVERGLAEADVVLEREFRTSWVHQGYIEPQVCTAAPDPLGGVTVYASMQALFHARTETAKLLGLPQHQVTVHAMPVGGGFGGKFGLIEPMTAAFARAVGRPVRVQYTRSEEFVMADPAPQSIIKVAIGAKRDGTLTTLRASLLFDAGSSSGAPIGISGILLGSFYRWEHLLVEGVEVLTHKAGQGAYRAPGAPQAAFAVESMVDEVAHALGMDPLEIRRRNAVDTGDLRVNGQPWPTIGLQQCLERAGRVYQAERAAAGPNEGVGIAMSGWPGGIEPASAACRLDADGTLQVTLGSVDLTGTNTTFEIVAAEAFGLDDLSQVRVTTADTDSAPYAGASGGSKITYTVGPAVRQAAEDARQQVLKIAAAELEASADDLEIVQGRVQVRGVPGRAKTLQEISRLSASFGAKYPPVYGRGQAAIVEQSPGVAVHVARVRVDPETRQVQPIRHVSVQDVGRAINPATVTGQLYGGAVQGVGWGLLERMPFDEAGTPLAGTLMDYPIPTASQAPDLEAHLVEVPSANGPFGAKGVGEPPVIPAAAALANAIRAASGARVTSLPMTAESVYRAVSEATTPA